MANTGKQERESLGASPSGDGAQSAQFSDFESNPRVFLSQLDWNTEFNMTRRYTKATAKKIIVEDDFVFSESEQEDFVDGAYEALPQQKAKKKQKTNNENVRRFRLCMFGINIQRRPQTT